MLPDVVPRLPDGAPATVLTDTTATDTTATDTPADTGTTNVVAASVDSDPTPEPRPITVAGSPLLPNVPRPAATPPEPRSVPLTAPTGDVSTPAGGMPRLAPSLPSAPSTPSVTADIPAHTAGTIPIEPELVEVVQAIVEEEESRFVETPEHPMAHLMPQRTKPTEAQLRAAAIRAARKKKSRRIKIIAAVLVIGTGALAGPPLAAWLVDAINESGKTSTDPTPSGETPADADTPATGVGSLLDDIDTLNSIVDDANAGTADG